ncbi:MAG: hypothetical protein AAGG08_11735 [Actinomycetota bacterium]
MSRRTPVLTRVLATAALAGGMIVADIALPTGTTAVGAGDAAIGRVQSDAVAIGSHATVHSAVQVAAGAMHAAIHAAVQVAAGAAHLALSRG